MREPCALTRSPTSSGGGSWCSVIARIAELTRGHVLRVAAGLAPRFDLREPPRRSRRDAPGVVPQQPPTMRTPKSFTNSASVAAIGCRLERIHRFADAGVERQARVRDHRHGQRRVLGRG